MRKLLIVALLLNAVCLLAICQPLSVLAGSGSGGGAIDACEGDPTKYALDSNADGAVDLSDGIYFLSWLFSGTQAPRVCLDTTALEANLAMAQADIESTQENLNTCQQTASDLQASLILTEGERDTALADLQIAQTNLAAANGQVTTLTGERDVAQAALATAEGERDTAQAALATAEAELASCLAPPVVTVGDDRVMWNDETLVVAGEATSDDPSALTLVWNQVGGPTVLFEGDGLTLTVPTPDVEHGSLLAFVLTATDSEGQSTDAQLTVTVNDRISAAVEADDVSLLPAGDASLLQRIIDAVDEAETRVEAFVQQIYDADAVTYDAGPHSQFFTAQGLESVLPVVIGNGGLLLAASYEHGGQRSAAYGDDIVGELQQGNHAAHAPAFGRLLEWLLDREAAALPDAASVRSVGLGSGSASRTASYLTAQYPNWTVVDCGDPAQWATCLDESVDLVVVGSANDLDPTALTGALQDVWDGGGALLYAHQHDWNATTLTAPILAMMRLSMQGPGGPGNYFAEDAAAWDSAASMVADAGTLGPYKTMAQRFLADDFTIDFTGCDGSCSGSAWEDEFADAASALRSANSGLDGAGQRLSEVPGETLHKLLVLLGDVWRADVTFPMDKDTTDTATFLRSYFSDYATLLVRDNNPAQPDLGNFSRSDFSHITPGIVSLTQESKPPFRTSAAYALPGQTFEVTRTDAADVSLWIRVNSLRSGSTHALDPGGYVRPKYLKSSGVPIAPGQTLSLTSPYGGPIHVVHDSNGVEVTLDFSGVGSHPVWESSADDVSFAAELAAGDYDWAEFVTSHFEVHSTHEKMVETMGNSLAPTGTALEAIIQTYHHGLSLALAGYEGPGIPTIDEVTDYATTKGWPLVARDQVQHFNADQATCGSGCSGNPYDAYWAFTPMGHGDLHEVGHNHERGRFKFNGREGHATTNYYSYYAKQQHFLTTGLAPDCQSLPFEGQFDLLQDAFLTADPYAGMNGNSTLNSWNHGASTFIQMMMAGEEAGAVTQGWHLVGRLHTHERFFEQANNDDTAWAAAKDGLGFSGFTRQEASNLSNNDFLLLAMGAIAGMDYRDYFDLWGLEVSAAADDEMALTGYPAVGRVFYTAEPGGACLPFDAMEAPIDGVTLYIDLSLYSRTPVDLATEWESGTYSSAGSSVYFATLDADIGPTGGIWWGSNGEVTELNVPVVRQSDGQADTLVVDAYQRRCNTLITLNAGRVEGCDHTVVLSVDPAKNAGLSTGDTYATISEVPLLLRGWRWHTPVELIETFVLDVTYAVP